jgi:hypothetical protein
MRQISARQAAQVWRHARVLFNPSSIYVPTMLSDWEAIDGFSREALTDRNQELVFRDAGIAALRDTIAALEHLDLTQGLAHRADIERACRKALASAAARGVPRNAAEAMKLISDELGRAIRNYTYVVPVMGLTLGDIDKVALGKLDLISPSRQFLESAGLNDVAEVADTAMPRMGKYLWIVGSEQGTKDVSYARFVDRCRLACGLLAVFAATQNKVGSHGYRIGVLTAPEDGYGEAVSLFWDDATRELTQHTNCRRARDFVINQQTRNSIVHSPGGASALRILDSPNRTPLEELWVRALYWYSDAHRDQAPVMRLLKFWSCVETFFSGSGDQITKSVTFGLAAALVYGDSNLIPAHEYEAFKGTLTRMYGQRCSATHGAAYSHVTDTDAANLSHWVAWLLWNIMDFMIAGMKTPEEVAAELRKRAPSCSP